MITPALPANSARPNLSGSRGPAVVGRRTVLSGVLGLAAGATLQPSWATAATARPAAGARIHSYGHSYTIVSSPYITRRSFDEYQLQLGRLLGSGPVISHGRSSTRLLDIVSAIIAPTFGGTTGHMWRPGNKGIVLLHAMMNDVSNSVAGGDPDYLNAYEKALRLALGAFGARSFIHADRASRIGGGWKVRAAHRLEGGHTWNTSKHNDKISFVVTGDSVHVSTLCTDPALLLQGTLRAECNGVTLGYFGRGRDAGTYVSNRGKAYTDPLDRVTQNRCTPAGWRLTGLNAAARTSGTKSLTLRKVDATVAPVWVQGVYLPSGVAPRVLVAKEPPRNPAATNKACVEAFYRNEPAYRALIDGVCNEYAAAYSVDLRPGWNNATMVSTKDTAGRFHPNTLGMSCIASNFERAVNKHVRAGTPGLR